VWFDNGKAPNAETVIVSDGIVLPDGTTVKAYEGGKCLKHQSGFTDAERTTRQCCNFYAGYLNPAGDWNFTGKELLRIRLFTNHPEHPITIKFVTAEPDWNPYTVAVIPANTLPLRQWAEVACDLRVAPEGFPDLTKGKCFDIYAEGFDGDRDDYYLLSDYWTVEKATTPLPLSVKLSPLSGNVDANTIFTLTGKAWGGTPPYTMEWLLNGKVVKTESTEATGSYAFIQGTAGTYHVQIRVTDSVGAQVISDTATIVVTEPLPPPVPARPIHVEGNKIKDDLGNTLHLRGVNALGSTDYPYPHTIDKDGVIHWGQNTSWTDIASTYIPEELDGLRRWGVNLIRCHNSVYLWLVNMLNTRENFITLVSEAQKRGIYVVIDFYSILYYFQTGVRQTPLPYPPYLSSEELAATGWTSSDDFVNFWAMVAQTLKAFPNIIFELWNEPNGDETAKASWFNVVQKCINAIRATGATQPIVVQWGYSIDWNYTYNNGATMSWAFDYPLTDPAGNIIYSTHCYRFYGQTGYYGTYATRQCVYKKADIMQTFTNCRVFEVAKSHPLLFGEIGYALSNPPPAPDGTDSTEAEKQSWTNLLQILTEQNIHYSAWLFWTSGIFALVQADQPNYQPIDPSGTILVAAIRAAATFNLTISTNDASMGTTDPAPGTYQITQGSSTQVSAIPQTGYMLDHWELDGVNVSTSTPYSVTMDKDHTLLAVFVIKPPPPPGKQHLTISSTTGGTTTPKTGVWEYDQGSTAQVTATPDKGYTFKQWILDNNPVTPVQPTITVAMDADHALVAVFEAAPPTPPTLNLLPLALLAGLVLIAPKR
jgi:hypothetical protein